VKKLIAEVAQLERFEMWNQITGEIYCTWTPTHPPPSRFQRTPKNGEWVKRLGEWQDYTNQHEPTQPSASSASSPSAPQDTNQHENTDNQQTETGSLSTEEPATETLPTEEEIEQGIGTGPISEPQELPDEQPSSDEHPSTEQPASNESPPTEQPALNEQSSPPEQTSEQISQ